MWQKLLNILRNKHFLSLASNGIMAVLAVLAVVTVAILYRFMKPAEIGAWFFFMSVFILLDTFRTGFLQTALIKFYAGATKERASAVVGSTWYLGLIVTGISFAITIPALLALPYITDAGTKIVIQWFSLTFLVTLPLVIAHWVLQAEQRFDGILYLRVINQGSFLLYILVLIALDKMTIQNLMIANVLVVVTTVAYIIYRKWPHLATLKQRTKDCIQEIFHFGKYSVGTTISANLLRSSDTFIINYLLGPAAVAVYNIPQRLMEIIEIPLRSFIATGMPVLSAAYNENNQAEVAKLLKKYAGILTVILIPVAAVALGLADIGVRLLGGEQYVNSEAANLFCIFMIFAIFFPIDRFMGITLDVIHQPWLNFIKVVIMLVINIAGDFTGIYLLQNLYGVALASIPTFFFGVLFGYICVKKYVRLHFLDFFSTGYREILTWIQNRRK
jgi:O-antigen/teichoic acid export membrane protein